MYLAFVETRGVSGKEGVSEKGVLPEKRGISRKGGGSVFQAICRDELDMYIHIHQEQGMST